MVKNIMVAQNRKASLDIKLFIVFILVLLFAAFLGYLATNKLGAHAYDDVLESNESQISALSNSISRELQDTERITEVLSGSPGIIAALKSKDQADIENANSVLDRYSLGLEAAVCYLLDIEGNTIASSNRNTPKSFVGKNYQFRPYFKKAISGKPGHYFALGITSGLRGYYSALPVKDNDENILGAAVVKKNVDYFEDYFSKHGHSFLIDPNGIIFISSLPEFTFRSLWPIEKSALNSIVESKQFGLGTFLPILSKKLSDKQKIIFRGHAFLVGHHLLNEEGWSLVLLSSAELISAYRWFGIALTVFVAVLMIIFFVILYITRESSRKISKSEERFKQISLTSRDWIWEVDKEGRYTYSNIGVKYILGYEPQEVIGKYYYDFFSDDGKGKLLKAAQEVFGRREEFTGFVNRNMHKDGYLVCHETSGLPIFDDKNNFVGYRGVDRDVTEQMKVQETLRHEKDYAELIFKLTPSAIFTVDKNRHITSWNKKAEEIIGLKAQEVIGKECTIFADSPCKDKCGLYNDEMQKPIMAKECMVRTRDGQSRIILKNADVIKDEYGNIVGGIESFEDITERRKAESDLHFFRKLVDQSSDAVFVINAESGRFLDVNQTACDKLNYERAELLSMKVIDIETVIPDDFSWHEHVKKIKEKGALITEGMHKRKDGIAFPVEVNTKIVRLSDKDYIIATVRDITERKQAAEDLRISESKYKALYEFSRDAIMVLDPEEGFVSGNPATIEMFRCKNEDEFTSKTPADLSPKYQPDGLLSLHKSAAMINIALEDGSNFFEWVHKRNDGEEFFATVLLTRMNIGPKTVVQATVRDISERKKSEDNLRKVSEFNQTLVSTIPFGMDIVDEDGNVLFLSDNLKKVFGEDSLGKKCWDLYRDDHKQCESCPLHGEMRVGDTATIETEGVLGGKTFQITHTAMLYDGKKAVLEIFEDITVRKETEDKLKELNKALEEQAWGLKKTNESIKVLYQEVERKNKELQKLDQLKSDFVSTVSHELRTPIAITTEGISLVLDGIAGPITQKQKDLLVTSKENIDRLTKIINDLLDMSKIEAGRLELRREFTDICELARKLTDSYQRVVATYKLNLNVIIPNEKVYLYIDGDKIIQALTNLLNNASKFTKEGGSIEVKIEPKESEVICSVKDTGVGIAPEDMDKLFDKFRQFGRKDGPGAKGTGLGLSITKALVQLHGGRIWPESTVGEGTTFFMGLPSYEKARIDFGNELDEILRGTHKTAFVLLEVKNFSDISTRYGQEALIYVMNTLVELVTKTASRPEDKIFLHDIHTLFVVLPESDRVEGMSVVNTIRKVTSAKKFVFQDNTLEPTIKMGLSLFPSDVQTRQGLIKAACDNIERVKKILIVDDHPQVVRILQMRLEDKGFCVECAYDGKQCLDLVGTICPDLIILDIMMPKMNGYEVYGRLKESTETAHIPVIFLSAHDVDMGKIEAVGFGTIPVIQKTGGFENVINVVKDLL